MEEARLRTADPRVTQSSQEGMDREGGRRVAMHREKLIPGKERLGPGWPRAVLASREGSWRDVKGCGCSLLTVLCPHPFFVSTWPLPGDGVSGYHQHPGHPLWEVCQDSQGRWARCSSGPAWPPAHRAGAGVPGERGKLPGLGDRTWP